MLAGDKVQVRPCLSSVVVGFPCRGPCDIGDVNVVGAEVASNGLSRGLVLGDGDSQLFGSINDVAWN